MNPLDRFLQTSDSLLVAPDGQMDFTRAPPRGLLPGSFNPLHPGHQELARVAARLLDHEVAYELSVANVDKPPLAAEEVRRRLRQFSWRAPVWLTHAPLFLDKAERFPGVAFVVGADTALRIVSPRYYDDDQATLHAALNRLRELGCRFLVACRVDAEGVCLQHDDLPIPSPYHELFQGIPPHLFRWDLSSTELRRRGHTIG